MVQSGIIYLDLASIVSKLDYSNKCINISHSDIQMFTLSFVDAIKCYRNIVHVFNAEVAFCHLQGNLM